MVIWRRGFGGQAAEREIAWPAGWRLPLAGEAIHLSREFGGFIETLDWDLGEGALKIYLR